MATSQTALSQQQATTDGDYRTGLKRLDLSLLTGIFVALGAMVAGMYVSGIGLSYFLQPTGALIVLGGTLGVVLITTPRHSLLHSLRRVIALMSASDVNREELVEEIIYYARAARRGGILSLEPLLQNCSNDFLRRALGLVVDVTNREELQMVLETELRMAERQGESDAKTLEVAGGFAPTIGIIGTVVGLIDVLRHFSNMQSVGSGIGTAFVSTIYGLVLANLILLPAAHRIRARVAENFDTQELIIEGVYSVAANLHPSLTRMRLDCFLRGGSRRDQESKRKAYAS